MVVAAFGGGDGTQATVLYSQPLVELAIFNPLLNHSSTKHARLLSSTFIETITTFSDGCLGSHNDEGRSEMRYVMRIAESSESSKL